MKFIRYPLFIITMIATIMVIYTAFLLGGYFLLENIKNLEFSLWVKIVVGVILGLSVLASGNPFIAFPIWAISILFGKWLLGFSFWEFAVFAVAGNWSWRFLKWIAYKLTYLTSIISPNKNFAFYSIIALGTLSAIISISFIWWTTSNMTFNVRNITSAIITTGLIFWITTSILKAVVTKDIIYNSKD